MYKKDIEMLGPMNVDVQSDEMMEDKDDHS